jgi:hypothetical protein
MRAVVLTEYLPLFTDKLGNQGLHEPSGKENGTGTNQRQSSSPGCMKLCTSCQKNRVQFELVVLVEELVQGRRHRRQQQRPHRDQLVS